MTSVMAGLAKDFPASAIGRIYVVRPLVDAVIGDLGPTLVVLCGAALPPSGIQAIVEFAYITGWRTPSGILPLEWRQVDVKAGEVPLDAGTTKNGEGRVFPFTRELRRVLEDQQTVAERLKREQGTIARYVFRYTKGQKTGQRITESGFNKAWRKARTDAGCPGRIPHDFRRTAVRNFVRAELP